MKTRVVAARARQQERQGCINARLEGRALRTVCRLADQVSEQMLATAATRLNLSVRAVTRVLRVARTVADLDASHGIEMRHLAEALHFRGAEGPAPGTS